MSKWYFQKIKNFKKSKIQKIYTNCLHAQAIKKDVKNIKKIKKNMKKILKISRFFKKKKIKILKFFSNNLKIKSKICNNVYFSAAM